jgi:hypothetical protein
LSATPCARLAISRIVSAGYLQKKKINKIKSPIYSHTTSSRESWIFEPIAFNFQIYGQNVANFQNKLTAQNT